MTFFLVDMISVYIYNVCLFSKIIKTKMYMYMHSFVSFVSHFKVLKSCMAYIFHPEISTFDTVKKRFKKYN